jgi:predicted nucleotidyltransferase
VTPCGGRLELPPRWLDEVLATLRRHAPEVETWAYGSRVTGGASEASDLDLVVRTPGALHEPFRGLGALREAFAEGGLPIHVDVVDWARVPEAFRQEIARAYVPLTGVRRDVAEA